MSYCTVDNLCAHFPQFKRAQTGSVSDAQIQAWIDGRKAQIRSALLSRGTDPDALVLTTDQTAWLRTLNEDGAIGDLGDALEGTMTLQPGEYSLAAAHRKRFEMVLKEIQAGLHDAFFRSEAAHKEVRPQLGGIAGAETDTDSTPADRGENRSFGRGQVF
jgi:hypothetical protein